MILTVAIPTIAGVMLVVGVQLLHRSTADLAPSVKSQLLVFGLVALGHAVPSS